MMQKYFFSSAVAALTTVAAMATFAATVTEKTSPVATTIAEQNRSAPQMVFESSQKSARVEQFVSAGAAARTIDIGPLKQADLKKSQMTTSSDKRRPLKIGFAREIPVEMRSVPLSVVPWQSQADGSRTFKVELYASEAQGIRIGYRFEGPAGGAEIRFAGNGREQVFKSEVSANSEIIWSPTMEGDRGTIELRVLNGFDPGAFRLVFEQLVHLTKVGKALKNAAQIGDAGDCNVDIACVSNPSNALLDIAKATAKMVFVDGGDAFLCTGTLLNSSPASGVPYFFTAAHCFDSQAAASTLNTYWFFDAIACDSLAVPPYQLVGGGSTLLVRDGTMDVMMLQMNAAPPIGAVFAGWDATVIPTNATVVAIHHPQGDLKKFSQGNSLGYVRGSQLIDGVANPAYLRDSYLAVRWTDGTTEEGSSGAGVFTFDSSKGFYTLRGGLEGGAASCANPTGMDRFSRMDLLYTKLAPYLQPSAIIPPTNNVTATMTEYYNPEFNFYFMTSREAEKNLLNVTRDTQQNLLWYPTGYWFKTDVASSPDTSSIVRYFNGQSSNQNRRGLHFYTASNADKQFITASGLERFSTQFCTDVPRFWCNEGIDSFVTAPFNPGVNGSCPAGLRPIYRAFRKNFDDGTHRFLPNAGIYEYVLADRAGLGEIWDPEGVAFCARP
jgi:lysyl endopeptidase